MHLYPKVLIPCVLILASCDAPGAGTEKIVMLPGDEGPAEVDLTPDTAPYETWSVTHSIDEMTDDEVTEAVASFSSGAFEIEVIVTCAGDTPSYQLSSYDGDRLPVPQVVQYQRWTSGPEPALRYGLRIDGAEPRSYNDIRPRYNNAIVIGVSPTFYEADARDLIAANELVFRLHLASGEATITVDQTDPALQSALARCVPHEPDEASHPIEASAKPATSALDTLAGPPSE